MNSSSRKDIGANQDTLWKARCTNPDALNRLIWKQQLAKLADVDPPIGSLFQSSVVEIEAVNINVRDDTRLQKCKSRL
jgi:hypothetical protein